MKAGVSPLPKSLGLAFAETILGRTLPLPVGLLFHTVWVTTFSVLYVVLFRDALTFVRALELGLALWLFVLVFFFPVVGWGFPWVGGHAQIDCGFGGAPPVVCDLFVGPVQACIQGHSGDVGFAERSWAILDCYGSSTSWLARAKTGLCLLYSESDRIPRCLEMSRSANAQSRCAPARCAGGKNRETGSQLRGQRWRV